jgi:transcriptional regulator with XRE-family HTH domain
VYPLADQIRYYREKNGLTQEELAKKINISRSMLSKWENGLSLPDVEAVIKLSDVFNVSVDTLLGRNLEQQTVLRELRERYQLTEEGADETLLVVNRYLATRGDIKKMLYQITQLSHSKRKAVEEILKVVVDRMAQL